MNDQLQSTLQTLQLYSLIFGILTVVGPLLIAAFLWRMSKDFITRKEFDGFGERVNNAERDVTAAHTRADGAHERIDRIESALAVELRYIRRDLDKLLQIKGMED